MIISDRDFEVEVEENAVINDRQRFFFKMLELLIYFQEEIEKNSIWGGGDGAAPDISQRMKVFKAGMQTSINYGTLLSIRRSLSWYTTL